MKKTFLSFAVIAGIAATLLTSCGKETTDSKVDNNGTYKGAHRVNIQGNDVSAIVTPIDDTLVVTVDSSNNVTIYSKLINRTLTGTLSGNNVVMDSLIFNPEDTLFIPSAVAPGNMLKVWDIRAGGAGTVNGKTATTELKIKSGKTNLSSPIDLRNLNGQNLSLKGTFNK